MDRPSAVYALTKKPGVGGSLGEFEAGPNRTITRRAHVDTKPALLPAVLARVHLAPRIFVRHGRLSLVPDLYGSLPYTSDAAPGTTAMVCALHPSFPSWLPTAGRGNASDVPCALVIMLTST